MDKTADICAAFFPNWRDNPYLDLLEEALRRIHVDVVTNPSGGPYRSWLASNKNTIDVLHFHWLSDVYSKAGLISGMKDLMKFGLRLQKAEKLNYRIVWTMHNLFPHERSNPILDRSMRRLILRFADVVIVHCQMAQEALRREFDWNRQIVIAPQGNYIDAYDNSCSSLEARRSQQLGDDSIVFLHLGAIRQYKGLDHLISSFQNLQHQSVRLIIAGKQEPKSWFSSTTYFSRAKKDSRISIKMTWIEDSEIQYYLNAADYFVAPFKNILSTGSLILAMSFGRPVIAPRLGCISELVPSDAGLLYDPTDEHGLDKALMKAIESDSKSMGARAFEVAKTLDWDKTANKVLLAYTADT